MLALLVEDDETAAMAVQKVLEDVRFRSEVSESAEDAQQLIKLYDFDVALLKMELEDMDGAALVRRLRAAKVDLPIMMLADRDDREERIRALIAGADDYMVKPLDREELSARLQTIVRRSKGHAASVITIGRMSIDINAQTVEIDGKPLPVTGKEYSILELLALRKGTTLTKETFLDHLYGGMDEPEQKIIDVFICKLRKKIAKLTDDNNIRTVWGRGYVLAEPGSNAHLAEDPAPFIGPDGPGWGNFRDLVERELRGDPVEHAPTEVEMLLLDLLPH